MDEPAAIKPVVNPSVGRFSANQVKTAREQELEDKVEKLEKALLLAALERSELLNRAQTKP
jgi:hypothetical protein